VFYASLKEVVGRREVTLNIEKITIKELIGEISKRFSPLFKKEVLNEEGKIKSYYKIIVNGRSISFLDGINTIVRNGDRVVFFPPICGG